MSIIPSVKVGSLPTLQRSYFTSQLFVNAARSDVETLLRKFDYAAEDQPQPFAIFKDVWKSEGWNQAHLFIWEDAARDEYLKTMFRLFLGSFLLFLALPRVMNQGSDKSRAQ
jgi:hypothetical protein